MAKNIFSEDRGVLGDAFENATDVEEARVGVRQDVKEWVVPAGILLMGDCGYCGLQWKSIVKWPEVMGFFLGQVVPGTQAAQSGVGMAFGCRKCGRSTPLTCTWDDVDRWVGRGVKMSALSGDIYRARDQILAERAKAQGRR